MQMKLRHTLRRTVRPRLASLLSILLVLLLAGCTISPVMPEQAMSDETTVDDATVDDATVAQNINLVWENVVPLWRDGELGIIDTFYADDYRSSAMAPDEPFDRDVLAQSIMEMGATFETYDMTVEEIFGEGDLVAVRYAIEGTPIAELAGAQEEILIRGISIVELRDGQVVYEWEAFDELGLLTQLGFVPAMDEESMAEPVMAVDRDAPPDATSAANAEQHRATIERLQTELWGNNNTDVIDELYSDDFVYHSSSIGQAVDKEGLVQDAAMLHSALSDVNVKTEAVVIAGNRAALYWQATGLHTGEVMGIPTQNEISYDGVAVYHFDDAGQIAHEWNVANDSSLLQQMGAFPADDEEASGDSAMGEDAMDGRAEVVIVATEYQYDAPESVASGITQLTIDNQGEAPHDISLIKLADGYTIDDLMGLFQAMGAGEDVAIPDWITFYGGAAAGPGQQSSYVVDLLPGNYVVYSFSTDAEGVPDMVKGMIQPLTVTEAESSVAAYPDADVTVELLDFSYAFEGDLSAGKQVLKVINNGSEPHEMMLFRLNDDASMDDFMTFMQAESAAGPPPFIPAGGAPPIAQGMESYHMLDLTPGNYVLICFIPSGANQGMPHFMLGMMQQLSVE